MMVSDHTAAIPGWRASILDDFTTDVAQTASLRVTVVRDPDRLLLERDIQTAIQENGFELLTLKDPLEFRYEYESRYRQLWDREEPTWPSLVVRVEEDTTEGIPYDILEQAQRNHRELAFRLADIFDHLDAKVIGQLDPADLDTVYREQGGIDEPPMGERRTKDFVLEQVYELSVSAVDNPVDLLLLLFRIHTAKRILPQILVQHLVEELQKEPAWQDWPLFELFSSSGSFHAFLQERWAYFLHSQLTGVGEAVQGSQLSFTGPADLPFDDDQVKIQVRHLFLEGYLPPANIPFDTTHLKKEWYAIGIEGQATANLQETLQGRFTELQQALPAAEADYTDWCAFAQKWADWWSAYLDPINEGIEIPGLAELHAQLEEDFQSWMTANYGSLYQLSPTGRPAMVHHIPRHMARIKAQKMALLVVDGLALDQWALLRESLQQSDIAMVESSKTTFAWVPTLTNVSRQAIFSGKEPFRFKESLNSPNEARSWKIYWESQGYNPDQISFLPEKKQEPHQDYLGRLKECAEDPRHKVLGIVVGNVDENIHGASDNKELRDTIKAWADRGRFREIIECLLINNFEVFVTSDHGSLDGQGIGKPKMGTLPETKGQRVYIFENTILRDKARSQLPDTFPWEPTSFGLPEDYFPLFPKGRGAFIKEGRTDISHGGITIEEVIVPFVKITRIK
jgi:hypothetical protein